MEHSIYGPLLNGDDPFITDICIFVTSSELVWDIHHSVMPPSSPGPNAHTVGRFVDFNHLILLSNSGRN